MIRPGPNAKRALLTAMLIGMALPTLGNQCTGTGRAAGLEITGFTLIRRSRIDRFRFEFTYRAELSNSGIDRQGVTAILMGGNAETEVVDDGLTFGDVLAGQIVTSADTFTIRQDRRVPLDLADLVFAILVNGPGIIPPDPADIAPALDRTVATTVADSTAFLYSGSDPIQTGMLPGTIDTARAAVLRGSVRDVAGNPIAGACISIVGGPQYGETFTRADGMYDMVVNGGSRVTIRIEKDGYFTAQRQVDAVWQDYRFAEPVVLVEPDSQVTPIDLAASTSMEVARGSVVTDADGSRQATLLFPASTSATALLPDGSSQPLPNVSVRATEFTVGDSGRDAMPAELPPTSAYTYAAEFSIDEALAVNATSVTFSEPVVSYTDNFLGIPTGFEVPVGVYDLDAASWVPRANGRVIEILGVGGGVASLDVDGSGSPATSGELAALGITTAERTQLASLYGVGATLWRVPLSSFSRIDFNFPWVTDLFAKAPEQREPEVASPKPKYCKFFGSIIECQNQVLGESIPIVGTPFTLNYRSSRVRGHVASRTLDVSLSGDTLPGEPTAIVLKVQVAGQRFVQSFPTDTNQSYAFEWDGLDPYGRELQGGQPAFVSLCHRYPIFLGTPEAIEAFGRPVRIVDPIVDGRSYIEYCQGFPPLALPNLDARQLGFGGWTLSAHHLYEPTSRRLLLGTGERRVEDVPIQVLTTERSGLAQVPNAVLAAPDGGFYYSEGLRVHRISPSGAHSVFAGGGNPADGLGDGGPATSARVYPDDLALGPDGSLYIAEAGSHRIRRVAPDGTISTVAGSGPIGSGLGTFAGDDGLATAARLNAPRGVAVAPDGTIFIADTDNHRIRRVSPEGTITTYAGTGTQGVSGHDGLAVAATLDTPSDVLVAPDGRVFFSEFNDVRFIEPTGVLRRFAGRTQDGYTNDGRPALSVNLNEPTGLSMTPTGDVVITNRRNHSIHIVRDGIITTIAGVVGTACNSNPDCTSLIEGSPGRQVYLELPEDASAAPDGTVLIADHQDGRILRLSPTLPNLQLGESLIPSEDGSEVYIFDIQGRHLETRDALSGATLWTFGFDGEGRLVTATDASGNVTTIVRDGYGDPLQIAAPFGRTTDLVLDFDGYLERITNPAGETRWFDYDANGLLIEHTDPRGYETRFAYDATGRLTRHEDAEGGSQDLARVATTQGFSVTKTTALGRLTDYTAENLDNDDRRWRITYPSGALAQETFKPDGSIVAALPEGTNITMTDGPDPRWGMRAPLPFEFLATTSGGLQLSETRARSITLADPNDLLSVTSAVDTVDVNGKVETVSYDASQGLITTTSPEGRQTFATRDPAGRILSFEEDGLAPTTFAYDAAGRITGVTEGAGPGARVTTYVYDAEGDLIEILDPAGRSFDFDHDDAGRPTRVIRPDLKEIVYGYDASGNLDLVQPPGRSAHWIDHDGLDRDVLYTPPALGGGAVATGRLFDLDRSLAEISLPDGRVLTGIYAPDGLLQSVSFSEATIAVTHDAAERMDSATRTPSGGGASQGLALGYDGPLLTSETWSGAVAGSVGKIYDDDLLLSAEDVNGSQVVSFSYDDDGLATAVGAMTVFRNPLNQLVDGTSLGGIATALGHNAFGELTDITTTHLGSALYASVSTRDALGRITHEEETIAAVTSVADYGYDAAGRLETVHRGGILAATYGYDDNGNRIGVTTSAGTTLASFDAQDRIAQQGTATYAYGASGQLASRTDASGTTQYQYDALGNLLSVTLPDTTQVSYVVDGLGRRVGRLLNGVPVQGFLYGDRLNPVAELDGASQMVSRFVYATRSHVPDYMLRGGATYRIAWDARGSVRLVADAATGAIAQRIDYDEFGRVLADTNPGFQPFGYAGGLYDPATGLVRFGARDYDPETGRWTSKDPIRFEGGDLNLYRYAVGDPMSEIDPSGLKCVNYPYKPRCPPEPGRPYGDEDPGDTINRCWDFESLSCEPRPPPPQFHPPRPRPRRCYGCACPRGQSSLTCKVGKAWACVMHLFGGDDRSHYDVRLPNSVTGVRG